MKYEKEFPTPTEALKRLRLEMSLNEFELEKKEMINAIIERFELKIGLSNTISNLDDTEIMRSQKEIEEKFRIFLSRINLAKLRCKGIEWLEEIIRIYGDSFSVRDLSNIYLADQQAIKLNLVPENTQNLIDFFKHDNSVILKFLLDEVINNIRNIAYRDSIHHTNPRTMVI
jgi:hypothetical protein